jgi:GAF domain-containing protein
MSPDAPPGGVLPPGHEHLVEQLRDALGRASELVARLSGTLASASRSSNDDTADISPGPDFDLEEQLSAARVDVQELSTRLVDTEHQLDRLMSLYVATYQLHAFLDTRQVHSAIADIAVNLLGAERFALLLRREGTHECEVVHAQGDVAKTAPRFAGAIYEGGDPLVDATLADGSLRIGPSPETTTIAAVPLKIQDEIVGALVVLKLFDHKPALKPDDRDLLDLLSAHAASALFAARLFASKDRKLKTLESLVRLARRE